LHFSIAVRGRGIAAVVMIALLSMGCHHRVRPGAQSTPAAPGAKTDPRAEAMARADQRIQELLKGLRGQRSSAPKLDHSPGTASLLGQTPTEGIVITEQQLRATTGSRDIELAPEAAGQEGAWRRDDNPAATGNSTEQDREAATEGTLPGVGWILVIAALVAAAFVLIWRLRRPQST
jgi:hypothetical protein